MSTKKELQASIKKMTKAAESLRLECDRLWQVWVHAGSSRDISFAVGEYRVAQEGYTTLCVKIFETRQELERIVRLELKAKAQKEIVKYLDTVAPL